MTTTPYDPWTDTEITDQQRQVLTSIQTDTDSLRKKLERIQRETKDMLTRMAAGAPANYGGPGSDLFDQDVADANRLNTTLGVRISMASALGIPAHKINAVYLNGGIG